MIPFSFPVFFVLFREATEAALVVAVLLSFIENAISNQAQAQDGADGEQTPAPPSPENLQLRKALRRRVWVGTFLGLTVSLAIGAILVLLWFEYSENLWPNAEKLWEASFSLLAAFFLTAMSIAFLRYESMARKWRHKLSHAVADRLMVLPAQAPAGVQVPSYGWTGRQSISLPSGVPADFNRRRSSVTGVRAAAPAGGASSGYGTVTIAVSEADDSAFPGAWPERTKARPPLSSASSVGAVYSPSEAPDHRSSIHSDSPLLSGNLSSRSRLLGPGNEDRESNATTVVGRVQSFVSGWIVGPVMSLVKKKEPGYEPLDEDDSVYRTSEDRPSFRPAVRGGHGPVAGCPDCEAAAAASNESVSQTPAPAVRVSVTSATPRASMSPAGSFSVSDTAQSPSQPAAYLVAPEQNASVDSLVSSASSSSSSSSLASSLAGPPPAGPLLAAAVAAATSGTKSPPGSPSKPATRNASVAVPSPLRLHSSLPEEDEAAEATIDHDEDRRGSVVRQKPLAIVTGAPSAVPLGARCAFHSQANLGPFMTEQEAAAAAAAAAARSLHGMFLIPFVTVLREGLEGVIFLAGIAISEPLSTIPLSGLAGLLLGLLLGLGIYQTGSYLGSNKDGNGKDGKGGKGQRKRHPLHLFFVCSSVMLLMLAAGLVARAVRGFEVDYWVRKVGGADDPDALDSYHVPSALWHFNCCNPNIPGIWSIAKSLVGWDNTGTIASVGAYCIFWLGLSAYLVLKKDKIRRKRARRMQQRAATAALVAAAAAAASLENQAAGGACTRPCCLSDAAAAASLAATLAAADDSPPPSSAATSIPASARSPSPNSPMVPLGVGAVHRAAAAARRVCKCSCHEPGACCDSCGCVLGC
ncbi:hypothetical protein HDU96_000130 [Phlyctochytrium bullatum]|nr:hypothetical protein HDU96_000130 [Phlyctochytrium bullatum]